MLGLGGVPDRQGAMGIDVLATNGHVTRRIQVKGNASGRREGMLSAKCEDPAVCDFYIFVTLDGQPEFHVVPAAVVAQEIFRSHQEWLRTPGRNGREHRDSTMRRFIDRSGEWLGRWDLLRIEE